MEINEHIRQMLGNEQYRMELAIKLTKNNKMAFDLLGMQERTFYRKMKVYGIVNQRKQKQL